MFYQPMVNHVRVCITISLFIACVMMFTTIGVISSSLLNTPSSSSPNEPSAIKCEFPMHQPNKWHNATIIANLTSYCPQTELCHTICVPLLDRGCELAPVAPGTLLPGCWIKHEGDPSSGRCVAHHHQLSRVSCMICNTTRDHTKFTPAFLGWRCNADRFCEGDHCVGDATFPQCEAMKAYERPCQHPSFKGCANSYNCSEKYHCNAPPGVACKDPTKWGGMNDDTCSGTGLCIVKPPASTCVNEHEGRTCVLSNACGSDSAQGVCKNHYCEVECPDAWYQLPGGILTISIGGGCIVVTICAIIVYCYYRRRRAALQNHLATMYWKMDQTDLEPGEVRADFPQSKLDDVPSSDDITPGAGSINSGPPTSTTGQRIINKRA